MPDVIGNISQGDRAEPRGLEQNLQIIYWSMLGDMDRPWFCLCSLDSEQHTRQ